MGKLLAVFLLLAFTMMWACCGGGKEEGPAATLEQTPQATPTPSYGQVQGSGDSGAIPAQVPIGYTLESGGLRATITDMYLSRSDGSSSLTLITALTAYNVGQSILTLAGEDVYLVHRGKNIAQATLAKPVELEPAESWQGTLGFDQFEPREHMTLVVSSGESMLQFAIQSAGSLRIEQQEGL